MAQTVQYKAGNGRFVKRSNPCAVAAVVSARANRERATAQARVLAGRRRDAARNGYRGPLTRAELAAAV